MKRIAIFFPGIGYHCDKPLLYYSQRIARAAGYQEIIPLGYTCAMENLRGHPERMRQAGLALFAQAEEALSAVRWEAYGDVLFVSKSVGTAIAAAYAKKHGVPCRNVFYTPVALTFGEGPRNGIAFTGTGDPWVETEEIQTGCREAGIPLHVVQGADHSLETGRPLEDLAILQAVMEETAQFLGEGRERP